MKLTSLMSITNVECEGRVTRQSAIFELVPDTGAEMIKKGDMMTMWLEQFIGTCWENMRLNTKVNTKRSVSASLFGNGKYKLLWNCSV